MIGGTNIQFAHDPKTGRVVVIEINPRTSRSSALASKATGFPIAFVSSLLAGGLTLDEIPYWRDGTLEKYTPSGDYVVVKFARWAFEKFKGVAGQARHPDAGRRRGHEHRQELQGGLPEVDPLPGNRPLRPRVCQGFQPEDRWRSCWTCWPSPPASGSSSCTRPCAKGRDVEAPLPAAPTSSPGSSSR